MEWYRPRKRNGLHLLFSKRKGNIKGFGIYIQMPLLGAIRGVCYGSGVGIGDRLKTYGIACGEDCEGLYWGDKSSEYGKPNINEAIWHIPTQE